MQNMQYREQIKMRRQMRVGAPAAPAAAGGGIQNGGGGPTSGFAGLNGGTGSMMTMAPLALSGTGFKTARKGDQPFQSFD